MSAKEIRRLGGHGPEAERVLETFWPYRIGNLAEAAGPPVRRPD